MTCASIRSTRSSGRERSGVFRMRSLRRSRTWSPSPSSGLRPSWASSWNPGSHNRSSQRGRVSRSSVPNKISTLLEVTHAGAASPAWGGERRYRHVCIVSTWANCGHAWGTSRFGEGEAAAYVFLGSSCNRGLGRTGSNRCRREQVQPDSRISIAEQLPDGCRREAMDNHRSRSIGNHSAFTRGVLTSLRNQLLQPCARKYSGEVWTMQQAGPHPHHGKRVLFSCFMLNSDGWFLFTSSFWSLHAFLICSALC